MLTIRINFLIINQKANNISMNSQISIKIKICPFSKTNMIETIIAVATAAIIIATQTTKVIIAT